MEIESNKLSKESSFFSVPSDDFITIYFKIHYYTPYGISVYLNGSSKTLGSWQPSQAIKLQWNQDNYWSTAVKINRWEDNKIEYKFFVACSQNPEFYITWEPGPNRIIPQYTLQQNQKREHFVSKKQFNYILLKAEVWGYRTIKLKLNYTICIQKVNSGTWEWCYPNENVANYQKRHKQNLFLFYLQVTGEVVQQWYYLIEVKPNNFHFRYYYVMKKEVDNSMIWERGAGRIINSANLDCFRSINDEFFDSPLTLKAQMHTTVEKDRFHSVKVIKTNGTFTNDKIEYKARTPVFKPHQEVFKYKIFIVQDPKRYTFNNNKGVSFFFFETFGRLNKIEWNFILNFQFDRINENILVGPYPQNEEDIQQLIDSGVKGVLNLQTQFDMYHRGINIDEIKEIYQKNQIDFVNYEILDMNSEDFIKRSHKAVQILKKLINSHENVYIHCTAGIGRAPSVVVLYLCSVLDYDLEQAIRLVKNKRKTFYIKYNMLKKSLQKTQILRGHQRILNFQQYTV